MRRKLFIQGSSIMETVIAISIITLCSLIAINLYARVVNDTPPMKKYEYEFELQKLMDKTLDTNELTASVFKFNGFTIEKRVSNSNFNDRLKVLSFIVKINQESAVYKMLVLEEIKDEL